MIIQDSKPSAGPIYLITAFAFSIFFVRFDAFIVNLAMPTFVHIFNCTVSEVSWVALSYMLAQVSAIMIFGKICDIFDIKRVFLLGIFIFGAASFLCGITGNLVILLGARILQGFGGSLMLVSAYAAVPYYLPHDKISWGLGIMTIAASLGILVGPLAGGWIIHSWPWKWLFWINIPLCAAAIIYSTIYIPRQEKEDVPAMPPLDWLGALYSALALLLLIFSLNQGQEIGWSSGIIASCFIMSVVFAVLFYRREKSCPHPLLDLTLFDNLSFGLIVLAMILGFLMFFGGNFLLPFYLTVQGESPQHIGMIMMIWPLLYIPFALYTGKLSDRISPRTFVIISMILSAISGFLFMIFSRHGGIFPVLAYIFMTAVSYAAFFSPINYLIIHFAGNKYKGAASAIYNTAMSIAIAIGISLMETVYSEFNIPAHGFSAAFCVGGTACLISAVLLSLSSPIKTDTPAEPAKS